ncbi:helix-turn-helix domain-containing protein [Chryseobacterium sp. MDT2-18]|uniref:helix-turn-helix domain-containing protein n=1 Tax=Chryseobacterium sp. MDT2-18 TaxID=1259136 RepID=UPI0027844529|nr:helix-turn-helix transcriptional regulator [Chryseobacterium sp. MDT2-18]MDQ0477093.1 transcriptional regulator with XRE-family HTH domain [Chryseobacterium sp. MDT2-18]
MITENNRIRAIIKKYREQYKFTQKEIAQLSGLTQSAYSAIEIAKGNIDFDRANCIAQAYGIKLWDFINPNKTMPEIKDLPNATRIIALLNKDKIISNAKTDLNLPERIMTILNSNKLSEQFTSSDIWKMLPIEVRDSIKTTRVTDTISRDAFKDIIAFTGQKRGREKIYQKIK